MLSAFEAVHRYVWLSAMAAGLVSAGCEPSAPRAPAPQPAPQPAAANEAPASPTLGWRFAAGDRMAYVVEHAVDSRSNLPDGRGMWFSLSQKFDLDWEVARVDQEGRATIVQRIRRARLRSAGLLGDGEFDSDVKDSQLSGPLAEAVVLYRAMLEEEFQFRMDVQGNVSNLRIPDAFRKTATEIGADQEGPNSPTDTIARILTDGMIPLPEGQAAPGAQWTAVRRWPLEQTGTLRDDMRYRWLADEGDYLGTPAVRIEIAAEAALEPKAGSPAMLTLASQQSEGYGLFDPAAGRLLSSQFEQKLEMTGVGTFAGGSQRHELAIRVDAVPAGVEEDTPPQDVPSAAASADEQAE